MLELLAISPEDGWAVVQSDGKATLIRPPYSGANRQTVTADDVEAAVNKHGFSAASESFDTWKELVDSLERQVAQSRQGLDRNLSDEELGKAVLRDAPTEILRQFLDRAEREWLPQGKWSALENMLLDILTLPQAKDDGQLFERAQALLRESKARKERIASDRRRKFGVDAIREDFPRLKDQAEDVYAVSIEIAERGFVLASGPHRCRP